MLRRSSDRRLRICACTVTSSAVVISSAITRCGFRARAIAIIARCCIPPDSSKGYWRTIRSGSGIRTSRRYSMLLRHACRRRSRRDCRAPEPDGSSSSGLSSKISAIWSPMVRTGLRKVVGFWKMKATDRVRSRLSSGSLLPRTSSPIRRMEPPTTRALPGSRPGMDSAVRDLPEPDSPTRPSVSPPRMVRLTSWSARIHFPPMPSSTQRSRTSSTAGRSPPGAISAQLRSRGSKTSRAQSPTRLSESDVRKMAAPGKITSHGAWKI